MKSGDFHPWRGMRDLGPAWKLRWSRSLPGGVLGLTNFATQEITLLEGMPFAWRRSTITHEVRHAHRGPVRADQALREELEVDRISSRLLMPSIRDVTDALVFHRGRYEPAAEDLWVDPWMLEVRLSTMGPLERGYYERRVADISLSGD